MPEVVEADGLGQSGELGGCRLWCGGGWGGSVFGIAPLTMVLVSGILAHFNALG